jgi:hypothetical protein
VEAVAIDAARRPHRHGDTDGGANDRGIELLALLLGLLLGVVEARQGEALRPADPLEIDQDAGGEQWTGQRAAAGLVDPRDETATEGAVEAEEAGRRPLLAALARRARRCRLGLGASRWRRPCR